MKTAHPISDAGEGLQKSSPIIRRRAGKQPDHPGLQTHKCHPTKVLSRGQPGLEAGNARKHHPAGLEPLF